jgi:hypothetical protein
MSENETRFTVRAGSGLQEAIVIAKLNKKMLAPLADFFGEGLLRGDMCIAILTPRHQRSLRRLLRARHIDVAEATRTEQYLALNAKNIIQMMGLDKDFDEALYHQKIRNISRLAAGRGQQVRAFGEITSRTLRLPGLGFYIPQNE